MKGGYVIAVVLGVFLVAVAIAVGLGIGLANHCNPISTNIINKPPRKDLNIEKEEGTVQNKTKQHEKPEQEEDEGISRSGKFKFAAVQTGSSKCSEVAADIMIGRGGSAVDAAVASLVCLGTVNPAKSGIGGGHIMTIYQAPHGSTQKEMVTILSRETLPGAGHRDFFKDKSSKFGGTAVGVPGEVMGLYTAWQRFGRVPWHQLVAPSIKLAEDGFLVDGDLLSAIEIELDVIKNDSLLREQFLRPDGNTYEIGDVINRPTYARTLRILASDPLSFYNGSLAHDLVEDLKEYGGVITKDDLIGYRSRIKEPIKGRLTSLNLTMYSPPPPSSGVILQLIMRLLDGFGFDEKSLKDRATSVETYQKLVESWKFAYAKRSALGDADFLDIQKFLANLTDATYIDELRNLIQVTQTRNISYYSPVFEVPQDQGTSHSNYYAPDGSAVAVTSTLNFRFGAKIMGRRTGIVFNNQMDDFSVPGTVNYYGYPASPSNYAEPGKSPMSSMSPTIMLTDDGQVAYLSGASGGSRIISSTSYVAFHNLYLKQDLLTAMDRPRIHHQLMPNSIRIESGFDKEILDGLKAKGHVFSEGLNGVVGTIRNYCATCKPNIDCPKLCLEAITDIRKNAGRPMGY